LPNSTLEAFRATLAEAIECDLLLLLVDVGDDVDEMERKLRTSIRELTERALDADETSIMERIQLVLTKCDTVERETLEDKQAMLSEHGFSNPIIISSHSGEGIAELQSVVLHTLFGPKRTLIIHNPEPNQMASEAILSRVFDAVYVHEHTRGLGGIEVRISASDETIAILMSNYGQRIELK
jgi:GTP-binding protein HflX